MNVLVLPSWYPNQCQNHGTYFQEQAQFLNANGFDIKILMVEELNTKNYWYQKLKRLLLGKTNGLSTGFLRQDPDAYSFPTIIQKSWTDEKKLKALDKSYAKAFKTLTNSLNWFPDVIHLQGMYKYGLSSYGISQDYNIPLVVIEHSPFKMSNFSECQKERIHHIFSSADKIAGVSKFHKDCLSVVKPEREWEVVWNFMDEDMFPYTGRSKSNNSFVITTILRPSIVKDPITFFEAIARFLNMYNGDRPVEIHVVGLSSLDDLTKMKGIEKETISKYDEFRKFITCYPWLDRDKIIELHQNSSIFVSTSRDEPYGVAIREAMLCGTPVICTKSGGPEDTVMANNGVLVEIGDVETIATKLNAMYNGTLSFDPHKIRQCVIAQSGCEAFLKRMITFYNVHKEE